MSTQLISEDKNHHYSLVQFYGGKEQGIMYQITQYNEETHEFYYYVQLSKNDLLDILKTIVKHELAETIESDFVLKRKKHKKNENTKKMG